MMADQVMGFIEGLIEKTKKKELEWKPFSLCPIKTEIHIELENGRANFDYGMNSIRESKSYFLESGEGYVFLFEIYHGDPDVSSPTMDSVSLMVKINNILPLNDISNYSEQEQELLERLKLLIEYNIAEKYTYPDVMYEFFKQVLKGTTEN